MRKRLSSSYAAPITFRSPQERVTARLSIQSGRSLLQRENDAMSRLLISAAEFGVVRIIGHGISSDELRIMLIKNEWLFRLSEKYKHYDKFLCDWSDNAMAKGQGHRGRNISIFQKKLEEVLNKLKGIAKEVDQIIRFRVTEQSWRKIESEEVKMRMLQMH
ncbi:hypothetical protein HAX54_042770 [Datura stramonium]|uniref:Uncharacterized protein n=1 Tax=Datura stramonium TaxID=4076 RepID=A0ABS8W1V8_DATST|nr:hypothetical protein [Datura stramonium]